MAKRMFKISNIFWGVSLCFYIFIPSVWGGLYRTNIGSADCPYSFIKREVGLGVLDSSGIYPRTPTTPSPVNLDDISAKRTKAPITTDSIDVNMVSAAITTGLLGQTSRNFDASYAVPCFMPNGTILITAPTCTGSTPDNNGKITLTDLLNTYYYGISSINAASYDGATTIATATPIVGPSDIKTDISNIGGTYIVRLFDQTDHCYEDRTVIIEPVTCCPTITNPSTTQTLCVGTAGSNITVNTSQNAASSIKFVKFTTDQTVTNGSETAAELAAIYGGTGIATVTPTGASSPYTATYTWNSADFPNLTLAPITYYVYAILNPDEGVSCRPVQEIKIVINPQPTAPSVTSPVSNVCPLTTGNLTTISAALSPSVSGGIFEWHISNSSSSALVGTPRSVGTGAYYLFEKSPDGCYSTSTSETVTIQTCCPQVLCLPITVMREK